MATITLTQGQQTTVDEQDLELVSKHKWCALKVASGSYYATTHVAVAKGKQRRVYLHRLITQAQAGLVVDHIDGNTLNNSRSNLRVCSHAQNLGAFRRQKSKNTSKYRGVYYSPKAKRHWIARLQCKGQYFYAGAHETEVAAAKARDAKALELWGEYADLNFPQEVSGQN